MTNNKHWNIFGCPVYILGGPLKPGRKIFHKWNERSKVGIYLERLPFHAINVSLVLDQVTGHTSPQFHVYIDP